jgi:hypothetical protein
VIGNQYQKYVLPKVEYGEILRIRRHNVQKKIKLYLYAMLFAFCVAVILWAIWPRLGELIFGGLGVTFAGIGGLFLRGTDTNSRDYQERNRISNTITRNQQELEDENRYSRERIDRVRTELAEAESIIGRSEIELDSVTRLLGKDIAKAKERQRSMDTRN